MFLQSFLFDIFPRHINTGFIFFIMILQLSCLFNLQKEVCHSPKLGHVDLIWKSLSMHSETISRLDLVYHKSKDDQILSVPVNASLCGMWYASQKEDTTLIGIHDQPVILAFLHSLPIHFQHLCQSRVSNPNSSLLSCRVQIRNPWLAKMHFQGIKIFRFILSSAD